MNSNAISADNTSPTAICIDAEVSRHWPSMYFPNGVPSSTFNRSVTDPAPQRPAHQLLP